LAQATMVFRTNPATASRSSTTTRHGQPRCSSLPLTGAAVLEARPGSRQGVFPTTSLQWQVQRTVGRGHCNAAPEQPSLLVGCGSAAPTAKTHSIHAENDGLRGSAKTPLKEECHERDTQFQKVKKFNEAFGLEVASAPRPFLFAQQPELARRSLDLICEEVEELKHGFQSQDLVEVTDALADLLYVVHNAGASFGIDMDAAFEIVHSSNMSKLCESEEEAQRTVAWYRQNMKHRYDSPAYRAAGNGRQWVVFNQSTGKPLKSINWVEPDFSAIGVRKETNAHA